MKLVESRRELLLLAAGIVFLLAVRIAAGGMDVRSALPAIAPIAAVVALLGGAWAFVGVSNRRRARVAPPPAPRRDGGE